jgi:hypothetical protein
MEITAVLRLIAVLSTNKMRLFVNATKSNNKPHFFSFKQKLRHLLLMTTIIVSTAENSHVIPLSYVLSYPIPLSKKSYHGKAQQALIAAIRDVHQQYLIYTGQVKTPN